MDFGERFLVSGFGGGDFVWAVFGERIWRWKFCVGGFSVGGFV